MPFAMIIRMHPGRHALSTILQSEQHYSEVQCVYVDGWMDVCHMSEVAITITLFMWISHW